MFGVRPGSPVLYTIPATGERPIAFSADNLPPGLALDASNGFITGTLKEKGEYRLTLHATNRLGSARKAFRIIVGDTIALTPPMGWNSWNCWGASVSQEKVLSSARALVEKGLRDHGWSYINIDDGWQGKRGGVFNGIQANPKFPDISELADDIHRMGLRFGIYSTPWNVTYAGHIGSYADHEDGSYTWISSGQHNENFKINRNGNKPDDVGKKEEIDGSHSFVLNDVSQWAAWGVDFLKYDWHVIDVPRVKEMHDALAAASRDIVYSLSNSAPVEEAANFARYSNLWRTTGDIEDSWKSMSTIGFNQDQWAPYSGPGHWNDPDMLIVGHVGWGNPHPTTLTPDEQYTHISLWSLLAAPLLIGCDLSALDDFTLSLLTNDEVIEVNQDPLGKQGICVAKDGDLRVYVKPLEDGSLAVGLFNLGAQNAEVTASWADLKISGRQRVRNLWTQKDIGTYEDSFRSSVASHGVVFLRLFPEE
ncbi:putative Ig domain-containing protein [Terrimicrobium sacchariphilum]|uniref:putative Ig domain-containing protein n=1 Tax=Terrimicrobium sacchariphilum TaxID=690879 RepID=UPI00192D04C9|nr:putative Ig domain-containing protein [Terrimicrobium sacchariphilum]